MVLPLLPTVPFVLLAAFCFSRSSPRLHRWLMDHPQFGPMIQDWQKHRAISRRAKWLATLSIFIVMAIAVLVNLPTGILWFQSLVLSGVLLFLWTRNEA